MFISGSLEIHKLVLSLFLCILDRMWIDTQICLWYFAVGFLFKQRLEENLWIDFQRVGRLEATMHKVNANDTVILHGTCPFQLAFCEHKNDL